MGNVDHLTKVPVYAEGSVSAEKKVFAVLMDTPYESQNEFMGVFTTVEKAEKFVFDYLKEHNDQKVAIAGTIPDDDYWTKELFIYETELK